MMGPTSWSSLMPWYVADRFVNPPDRPASPRIDSSLATSPAPAAIWPSSCTDRGKKWSLKSCITRDESFEVDGRETMETPMVKRTREIHSFGVRGRPRMTTLKNAVVRICGIGDTCQRPFQQRRQAHLPCARAHVRAYLELVYDLEMHVIQIAQSHVL